MKVVGSGSPAMLTIRVKRSEVALLEDVLCEHRAEVTADAAAAHAANQNTEHRVTDRDVEDPHDELFLITKLLDALRQHVPPDQPRELVAPTWLLDPIIRTAATTAAERLTAGVELFSADRGTLTADQLRARVDTAAASAATLIGLDYVQNGGVE